MSATYTEFLAGKRRIVHDAGRVADRSEVHPTPFDFQRDIVLWALRKGRAAIFADTGLGKTIMQVEWARLTGERTLILTPLAVADQTIAEAADKLGVEITYARHQGEAPARGITITNYERLDRFDHSSFGAVVLDECFAPGTIIDTPSGGKCIETIRVGDYIVNSSGIDVVSDVHRREVPYAVRINHSGTVVTASPNHPFFTQRGWVCAQDLKPGDGLMATTEAMRMVRGTLREEDSTGAARGPVLRSILLSELADDSARDIGEGTQPRGGSKERPEEKCLVGVGRPQGVGRTGTDTHTQPDRSAGSSSQDLPLLKGDELHTFRAWGQRNWFDRAAGDDAGCAWTDMDAGVRFVTGPADCGLSDSLQARLSESRSASRYRGGWVLPRQSQGSGPQEGREAGFARVDGIEVLQPGDSRLDQWRDAEGKLYFYDLGATRHPSYSVVGRLVHNSSILKAFSGTTKKALVEAFKATPYRLCCTATPAPNDLEELCNHADFLGWMKPSEMRSTFFIADSRGQFMRYRLKRHAHDAFYRWLASWAMAVRLPSDLGYDDEGFVLPGLGIHPHFVDAEYTPEGRLFVTELYGVTEQAQVRRATMPARVAATVQLVKAEPDEQWLIWRGLIDEGRGVAAGVPGAVLVEGSDDPDAKAAALLAFAEGRTRVLVTAASIAGFGLNFQRCARMAFVGLGYSYEQYYQALRRCYRFGQKRRVEAHIVLSDLERPVLATVLEKERQAAELSGGLLAEVRDYERAELFAGTTSADDYEPREAMALPTWMERAS